jgi:hypothetical protein
MKTLREVLLEKHRRAEPKLDTIREQVNAGLAAGTKDTPGRSKLTGRGWRPEASAFQIGWRQLLWSLRWHLAGLSAVWLVVVALNIDHTPDRTLGATGRGGPSPRQLLAALRENQRQLRELIAVPASEPAQEPQKLTPSPQSQIRASSTAAV